MAKKEKVKKPFYKKVWVWVLAIIVIGSIATSGGEEEDTTDSNQDKEAAEAAATSDEASKEETVEEPKEDEVTTAKVGEEATVADVGFTVTDVQTTSEIDSGNQFVDNATTNGKFVILDVEVNNGKKEALTINSSYFKIITKDDTEYEPITDGEVMMAMGDNMGDFFLEQINPGLSKSGKVVFEVGEDVDLQEAVLHCQTGVFGTESIEIALK